LERERVAAEAQGAPTRSKETVERDSLTRRGPGRLVHPLMVDGPLKGKEVAVSASSLRWGYHAPRVIRSTIGDFFPALGPSEALSQVGKKVTYRFYRFGFLGRTLWVGTCIWFDPSHIDLTGLADQVLSERAKRAEEEEGWETG
jgi:hypothetical protein